MKDALDVLKVLDGLSVTTIGGLVILGAFGLAAFAIYAVLAASRGRR